MASFAMEMSDLATELRYVADNADVMHMAIDEMTDVPSTYKNALFLTVCRLLEITKRMEEATEAELARRRAEHDKQN